jgi:S1-C subfamily serine protease
VKGKLVGIIEESPEYAIINFKSVSARSAYRGGFKDRIDQKFPNRKKRYKVDNLIGYPSLNFASNSIMLDGNEIGIYSVFEERARYYLTKGIIKSGSISDTLYDFISERLVSHVRDSLDNAVDYFFSIRVQVDTDLYEDYARRKKLEAEDNARRNKLEEQRISRFYQNVYDVLNDPLESIEGIYRSIDFGEYFEYDIFLYHSLNDPRRYNAWILNSTDSDLTSGNGLFSLRKTAREDAFLLEYQNKAGYQFQNKLATYKNEILEIGLKSFIKLYPANDVSLREAEFMPSVDWVSSGSGVLLNNSGYIATNYHVVEGADSIRVQLLLSDSSLTECTAKVLVQNKEVDIAILKLYPDNLPSLGIEPLTMKSTPSYGETVYSLGFPIAHKLGENVKLNKGIVSALTDQHGDDAFFQTDLPLWYGNSGGPCFSESGMLMGLATRIFYDDQNKVENVSFISKVENIAALLSELSIELPSEDSDETLSVEDLIPYTVFIKVY